MDTRIFELFSKHQSNQYNITQYTSVCITTWAGILWAKNNILFLKPNPILGITFFLVTTFYALLQCIANSTSKLCCTHHILKWKYLQNLFWLCEIKFSSVQQIFTNHSTHHISNAKPIKRENLKLVPKQR